jgi:hypothetical protein
LSDGLGHGDPDTPFAIVHGTVEGRQDAFGTGAKFSDDFGAVEPHAGMCMPQRFGEGGQD